MKSVKKKYNPAQKYLHNLTLLKKIYIFVNHENLNHGDITFQNMKNFNLHIISAFADVTPQRGDAMSNSPWFKRRNLGN